MEDLITKIKSSELSEEEKIEILKMIIHASVGTPELINNNFYLKVVPAMENKEPEVQLWCIRKEKDGVVHGNTHFSNDVIIQMLHQKYVEENKKSVK